MKWKDYGTPLVLGLLVGGALLFWQPTLPEPPLQEGAAPPCEQACYTWMFDGVGIAPDHTPRVLVVREDPAPFVDEPVCAEPVCPTIRWHTPYVGTVDAIKDCPCPAPLVSRPLGDARVDVENQTVSLTFYAFNDLGELLTTNIPTAELERFRLYGDFTHWNTRPWYFGTGNVTGQVPEVGVEIARASLDGVPVGGIVTIHLERHEYDWLLGPVWITARVDAVQT